jgi:hypothetical protein
MLFAGSALAGLTLVACGGDSGGGTGMTSGNATGSKADASVHKDTGAKKDAASPTSLPGLATGVMEGDKCTGSLPGMCDADQCDAPPCGALCVGGVYGECKPATQLINSFTGGDGGFKIPTNLLGDAGLTINADAGVHLNDAGTPVSKCPSQYTCETSGILGTLAMSQKGTGLCAENQIPPACETTADCGKLGFSVTACLDASGMTGGLSSALNWPAKICAASCAP